MTELIGFLLEPSSPLLFEEEAYPVAITQSEVAGVGLIWLSLSDGSICILDRASPTMDLEDLQVKIKKEDIKFYILRNVTGNLVCAISEDGLLLSWLISETGEKLVQEINTEHNKNVVTSSLSSRTETLWSGDSQGRVIVWKPSSSLEQGMEMVVKIEIGNPIFSMEEVQQTVWIGSLGRIFQVHGESFTLLESWNAHGDAPISGIRFNPFSSSVWSYSNSTTICAWNSNSGELINTFRDFSCQIWSLVSLPNSPLMIAGSIDGRIFLSHSLAGEILSTWDSLHDQSVRCINYSDNSRYPMVSSSIDGKLVLWNRSKKTNRSKTVVTTKQIQRHLFRTKKNSSKKPVCAVCSKNVKVTIVYCKECRMSVHADCKSSAPKTCPGKPGAFPGIPMKVSDDSRCSRLSSSTDGNCETGYSRVDRDPDVLSRRPPPDFKKQSTEGSRSLISREKRESLETIQKGKGESKVRVRYFDLSYGDVPFAERLFDATSKGASAKEDLLMLVSELKRVKTNMHGESHKRMDHQLSPPPRSSDSVKRSKPRKPKKSGLSREPTSLPALNSGKVIVFNSGSNASFAPSNFVFKIPGFEVYILKEDLPFHRLQYIQACKLVMLPPILDIVPVESLYASLEGTGVDISEPKILEEFMENRTRQISANDLLFTPKIRRLTGGSNSLATYAMRECDEVMDFRRALTLERIKWYQEEDELQAKDPYRMPRYYCNSVPPKLIDSTGKINIEAYFDLAELHSKKTISTHCLTTADSAKEQVFDAMRRAVPAFNEAGIKTDEYILKVPGMIEYLYGDAPLINYDYIRGALSSNARISLRLVPTNSLPEPTIKAKESLADQLLSQDMTRPKEFSEPPQSIYFLDSPLSLSISGVEGITSELFETKVDDEEETKEKKKEEIKEKKKEKVLEKFVVVEGAILYGEKVLSRAHTAPVPISDPVWGTVEGCMIFKSTKIQNISPGSRVCFTLVLCVGEKRTPLSWGNIQLIGHDSKTNTWSLQTGPQVLLMWPESKKINLYKSIGLCSNNVCGEDAPQLFVEFPTYPHDVIIPPAPRNISYKEVLEQLSNPSPQRIKKDLFDLKERLKEPEFKEPFLENGGLRLLCDLVRRDEISGNVLSYCLGAMEVALEVSLTLGIGWESITIEDIEYIVGLNGTKPNLNVAKPSLRFLTHMIILPAAMSSCHLGFPIVYSAMLNVADQNKHVPLFHSVNGLSAFDDIDMSGESLRLINAIVQCAPTRALQNDLLESLHELHFKKGLRRILTFKDSGLLLECVRYQSIRLAIYRSLSSEQYDSTNPEHEEMLKQYWKNVFPKQKLSDRVSDDWLLLGFQSNDPANDFKEGILGLSFLLYFSTTHKKDFRELVAHCNKAKSHLKYPFSFAGNGVAEILLELFRVPEQRSLRQSQMVLSEERLYKVFFDGDEDNVLEEMFCSVFQLLNQTWFEMKGGGQNGTANLSWVDAKEKVAGKAKFAFENAPTLKDFQRLLTKSVLEKPAKKQQGGGEPASFAIPEPKNRSDNLTSRMQEIEKILNYDCLTKISPTEKRFLWKERHLLISRPEALSKFLLSVDWADHRQVAQSYQLLTKWAPPSPHQAIELLDARFTDPIVRSYAVTRLDQMSDEDCTQIVLQLCQVLKYEAYHDSALARFLLRRAYRNEKIGHCFYWDLRAEIHIKEIAERYTLLLEAYIRGCGDRRAANLMNQHEVMETMTSIAVKVKAVSAISERKEYLHQLLYKAQDKLKEHLGNTLLMPLDQRLETTGLVVEKCKSMDSKQVPLWLVFENADSLGDRVSIILKVGDDLRQDALTLQMMRLMDKLWKKNNMNLGLKLYGCVATGFELGMLEVVKNAETTAGIQREAGGATKVISTDVLTNWLLDHNPGTQFNQAQKNFARSCAGYCVATYILGIADRHNDNIMVTKDGFFFHIDFGHFLGNYKKKFGYQRETTPFVFTDQFAHVLKRGKGDAYHYFKQLCMKAYNIVRHDAPLFLNLFQLMLCGGIAELQSSEDIHHLQEALSLGLSDEEAGKNFLKKITEARRNIRVLVMGVTHILVH